MGVRDRLGIHSDPPLAAIPATLEAAGVCVFQTCLRDPRRLSREGIPSEDDQDAFRAAAGAEGTIWGIAHASMLTSLGSTDPRIRNASASALCGDAALAASLGLSGVCFHVGYEKGHPDRASALDAVARKLAQVVERLPNGARVLLENGCEGTELGQTVEEVAAVVRAVGAAPEQVGVVLDTCHLHVAGFDLAAEDGARRLVDAIEASAIADRLVALHLNDARFACGSKRDRHATPGEGTIGAGLLRVMAEPLFAGLPAILEVDAKDASRGLAYLRAG
ncbi:MAG TPA: deoxyribonuclease IV [Chthonomonadales bacterium]|nr:deoxyribonuclease IV [Chthonomonadales bacterium]